MKVAKKFAVGFTVSFLISYMLFIFGPAEIFFVNTSEFRFIYKEFAWPLAGIGFAFALMIALLIAFLPENYIKWCCLHCLVQALPDMCRLCF